MPDEIIPIIPDVVTVVQIATPGPQGVQGPQGPVGDDAVVPTYGLVQSIDARSASSSGSVVTANRAYYVRATNMLKTVTGVSQLVLMVANSSGNICVGVYANSGSGRAARPTTRKATTGAIACPGIGVATVSLGSTISIDPGDWLALSCDNTTATFARGSSIVTAQDGLTHAQAAAHPLPSSVGTLIAGAAPFYIGAA